MKKVFMMLAVVFAAINANAELGALDKLYIAYDAMRSESVKGDKANKGTIVKHAKNIMSMVMLSQLDTPMVDGEVPKVHGFRKLSRQEKNLGVEKFMEYAFFVSSSVVASDSVEKQDYLWLKNLFNLAATKLAILSFDENSANEEKKLVEGHLNYAAALAKASFASIGAPGKTVLETLKDDYLAMFKSVDQYVINTKEVLKYEEAEKLGNVGFVSSMEAVKESDIVASQIELGDALYYHEYMKYYIKKTGKKIASLTVGSSSSMQVLKFFHEMHKQLFEENAALHLSLIGVFEPSSESWKYIKNHLGSKFNSVYIYLKEADPGNLEVVSDFLVQNNDNVKHYHVSVDDWERPFKIPLVPKVRKIDIYASKIPIAVVKKPLTTTDNTSVKIQLDLIQRHKGWSSSPLKDYNSTDKDFGKKIHNLLLQLVSYYKKAPLTFTINLKVLMSDVFSETDNKDFYTKPVIFQRFFRTKFAEKFGFKSHGSIITLNQGDPQLRFTIDGIEASIGDVWSKRAIMEVTPVRLTFQSVRD